MRILATLFGLLIGSSAFCQAIEIFIDGDLTDVSGTVVTVPGGESLHEQFDIHNASGGILDLACTRVKISEITGSTDYLCWGLDLISGVCYAASTVSPADPWTTPDVFSWAPGDTGLLSVYYNANGYPGTSLYRYYIVEDGSGTLLDSVDVEYVSTVSVDEVPDVNVAVFPNPAKLTLNVNMNGSAGEQISIAFYGLAGDKLMTAAISEGMNKLDISKLSSGVYFYSILDGSTAIETRKLVVR